MRAVAARLLLVTISAAVLAGCTSGGSGDKAGGNGGGSAPTVLTLAAGDADRRDVDEFVRAVTRLSHGSLRIGVQSGVHARDVSYETELIADVRAGRYDMAQVGARAFDLEGVTTLDPLVAPFLVQTPTQEERVLVDRSATRGLLSGLHRLHLVGIGIVPGDIRYLLGVSRLLRTVADLRGARIGIRPSRLAAEALRSLGARSTGFVAGGALRGLDGAEQDLPSIVGNGYDRQARGVTVNIPLWPRSQVIAISADSYSKLSTGERAILARAAQSAIEPATRRIEQAQRDAYRALCSDSRFEVTTAIPADVAQMERLASRLVTNLQREPRMRLLVRAIRRDIAKGPAEGSLPRCASIRSQQPAASPTHASELTGSWTANATRDRYFAAGPLPGEDNAANWGMQSLALRSDGTFVLRNRRFPASSTDGAPVKGAFRVRGAELDLLPGAGTPANEGGGETWRYRWSLFHGTLTLRRYGDEDQPTALIAAPFKRDS